MTARVLEGKALAEAVRAEVRAGVEAFRRTHGRAPGLDVVLVGDDPASVVYTRNKERASNDVGMRGKLHALPATASEAEVLALLRALDEDPSVDGVLVQLPLPNGLDARRVLDAVDPRKDVDGFHPVNAGKLLMGYPGGLVACTPLGCMRLLAHAGTRLEGAHAVVIGNGLVVGRPMAQLLLAANATVTTAHAYTRDLPALCRLADVLVVAAGRKELVRGDWIKPGATVVDVGANRVDLPGGHSKLYGDVAFDEAREVAAVLTPVPGGVGPMTIAMLLANTLEAARRRMGSA
jgi:methylenetetrahydrofolate dehydrogenase (NADP+)/methenyltetrahydrofolate cyclohydrolase